MQKWLVITSHQSLFAALECYEQLEGKSRWKNGVVCLISMFPSWVMELRLSRKCIFGIVYCAMTDCFGNITVWSRNILLNFCWVSTFFDILIAYISWTVDQTLINHIIFWKSIMRNFRGRYVDCFNRLKFLAEVSTKLQKMHF